MCVNEDYINFIDSIYKVYNKRMQYSTIVLNTSYRNFVSIINISVCFDRYLNLLYWPVRLR